MDFNVKVTIDFSDAVKNFLGTLFGGTANVSQVKPEADKPEVSKKKETSAEKEKESPSPETGEQVSDATQKKIFRKQRIARAEELGIKSPGKKSADVLEVAIAKAEAKLDKQEEVSTDVVGGKADAPVVSGIKIEDVRAFVKASMAAESLSKEDAAKVVDLIGGFKGDGRKLKDIPDAKLSLVLQAMKEQVAKNSATSGDDDGDI